MIRRPSLALWPGSLEGRLAAMPRHLRSLLDLDANEMDRLITLAIDVKKNPKAYRDKLQGCSMAMIFSKPSTRTRVSFEVGVRQLGGHAMFLSAGGATGLQVNRGESNHDTAKVLSRYVDAIIIRTFAQQRVDELAEYGSIPVINALTDAYHPCQALADVLTLRERFGDIKGLKLVYVGPGNNVTHSLMLAGPRAGFDVVCACPASLPPDAEVLERAQSDAAAAGTKVSVEHDAHAAVAGAQAIYTDTWVSMGQEKEADTLEDKLATFQVDAALMEAAADDAIFMHCLPAHRGDEVLAEVIDGPQSVIFDEAENRLHSQKALMLLLMEAVPWS
jgi:ornithine carbamoyltransferase